jgi:hypothetical protein
MDASKTLIIVPKQDEKGDIIIEGRSAENIEAAKFKILAVVESFYD